MAHNLTNGTAPIHRRVRAFIIEELEKVLPPTIFFVIGFNLIVLSQRILLADYLLRFAGFMVATMTALVVGKAVLLANHVPFLGRYDNQPLIKPILFKTLVYWACVFVVRLIEAYVHYIIDEGRVVGFISYLVQHFMWHRFLFVQLWILVLFLLYTTGAELNHLFGDGELYRVLFKRGSTELKQTRRQRIRTLTRLGRLADTAPTGAFSDPTSSAHAALLELLAQLRGPPQNS